MKAISKPRVPRKSLHIETDPVTGRRRFWWHGRLIDASVMRALPEERVRAAFELLEPEIRDALAEDLRTDWSFWARQDQLVPAGEWSTCLVLAGRGFGKSRMGAQAVIEWHRQGYQYVNLIGATVDDAWDIMVDGESGLLACCPIGYRPTKKRHERKLVWPNGATIQVFTADEPERLRGKQHQKVWADELCAWRYPEAWDQLKFGLRLPSPAKAIVKTPQAIVTTTPKPTKVLREIMADPTTLIIRGKTSDNKANLAPTFYDNLLKKYAGTRLGRQELNAEVLEDNQGALWNRKTIDACRASPFDSELRKKLPEFVRIVVSIDPSVTANEDSDETGIIVAALGLDGRGYVLEDATPDERVSPQKWAERAVGRYKNWGADRVVAEVNNGGDLVEAVIRAHGDANVSYKAVRASKGKVTRAEPIAALYEQGRITHLGVFSHLEDQMCEYNPSVDKKSPDRMDALVWALTELMLGDSEFGMLDFIQEQVGKKIVEQNAVEQSKNPPPQVAEPVVEAAPEPTPVAPDEDPAELLRRIASQTRGDGAASNGQSWSEAVKSHKALSDRLSMIDKLFDDEDEPNKENPDGW